MESTTKLIQFSGYEGRNTRQRVFESLIDVTEITKDQRLIHRQVNRPVFSKIGSRPIRRFLIENGRMHRIQWKFGVTHTHYNQWTIFIG